jgi:hypothetical protein
LLFFEFGVEPFIACISKTDSEFDIPVTRLPNFRPRQQFAAETQLGVGHKLVELRVKRRLQDRVPVLNGDEELFERLVIEIVLAELALPVRSVTVQAGRCGSKVVGSPLVLKPVEQRRLECRAA